MTLALEGYMPRLADGRISALLRTDGAVRVEGPRRCGKTWTALSHANSAFSVTDGSGGSLNRRLAERDPRAALEGEAPHLVDDWQAVPGIWDAALSAVSDGVPGRLILAGSSAPARGRGRRGDDGMAVVRMRTMSLLESGDSSGAASISGMFRGEPLDAPGGDADLRLLAHLVVRGGWPEAVRTGAQDPELMSSAYVDFLAGEDFSAADGEPRDPRRMMALVRALGRAESRVVTDTELARDMRDTEGVSATRETVADLLRVLDAMFLTADQPAFDPAGRPPRRTCGSPKRHLADPSISAAAIGAGYAGLQRDPDALRPLFEGMCERDLSVYAESLGGRVGHYSDGNDLVVDATVELPDGRWGAFEIELGAGGIDEAAWHLLRADGTFRDDGVPPEFLCVISGLADCAYRREDGVYVAPITALGPRRPGPAEESGPALGKTCG